MANTRRILKDYLGFKVVVINRYRYVAYREDLPPMREHDACLTFRANDLRTLKKKVKSYLDVEAFVRTEKGKDVKTPVNNQ